MIQVSFRTNIGFVALRIAVISADDLAGALQAQEGFTIRPLPDYLRDGITAQNPITRRYRSPLSRLPRSSSTSTAWGQR